MFSNKKRELSFCEEVLRPGDNVAKWVRIPKHITDVQFYCVTLPDCETVQPGESCVSQCSGVNAPMYDPELWGPVFPGG